MRRAIFIAVLVLAASGAAPAAADPVVAHFQSPSGNINCIGGTAPAYVECQARTATWPHPRTKRHVTPFSADRQRIAPMSTDFP